MKEKNSIYMEHVSPQISELVWAETLENKLFFTCAHIILNYQHIFNQHEDYCKQYNVIISKQRRAIISEEALMIKSILTWACSTRLEDVNTCWIQRKNYDPEPSGYSLDNTAQPYKGINRKCLPITLL